MKDKRTFSGYRAFTGLMCLAVLCLFAATLALGAEAPAKPGAPQKHEEVSAPIPATSDMDALTCIFTRRSIRKYTSQPVPDDKIKLLLQAAMSAPSARNEQSWEFIIIRDKNTLKQVPSFHPFAKHIPDAPVAIVVVGNKKLEAQPGLWALDCANATMNILLAAHSMGLGAVWTTLYPYEQRMTGMTKLLGLPENIVPLAIVPIGYPAEKLGRVDRFNPAKIHNEKW
jgi:nitroreductase